MNISVVQKEKETDVARRPVSETRPWLLDSQLARVAHMMPVPDLSDHIRARADTEQFGKYVGESEQDERLAIYETHVDQPYSDHRLRVRIYRPKDVHDVLPCIVYMHGGGFVLGDLDMEDPRCQRLAADAKCVVVSVDFRLAPEFAYPHGLNDCFAALCWAHDHASELNINASRLAVAGCSTGATLAAALALKSRDEGGPGIHFQMLLYPALDDTLGTESMNDFVGIPGGDKTGAELMWRYYLSGLSDTVPYLAAPYRAKNLQNLPSTFLMVNDIDVCRDEAIHYGQRLLAAGIPMEMRCYSGTFHAFEIMVRTADISRRALDDQIRVLIRALHTGRLTDVRRQR